MQLSTTPSNCHSSGQDRIPTTAQVHVALWGHNPDVTYFLSLILARAGLTVCVVDSAEAALHGDADVIVIDCSVDGDALDHCLSVVTRTTRPVHICHPRQEFVADLTPLARGLLVWLPPAWTGLFLLDKARTLLAQATTDAEVLPNCAAPDPHVPIAAPPTLLTPRERQVQRLVYLHHSNAQIAAQLGIAPHTVKNHITEGMARLDLHSRRAFGAAYAPSQGTNEPCEPRRD